MGSSIRELMDRARLVRPKGFDASKLEPGVLTAIDGDRHEGCGGFLSDRSPPGVPFWKSGSYNNPSATREDLSHRERIPLVLACAKCKRMYRSSGFRVETHEENGGSRVEGYELDGVFHPR
jgi:hypothetical protein